MSKARTRLRQALVLTLAAGFPACSSTADTAGTDDPADPWRDLRGTLPGSFSALRYNLAFVELWDVRGDWIEVVGPDGTAKQAVGEGPHKVVVKVSYEAEPRAHEVGPGTVVGTSGRVLLIEDPTEAARVTPPARPGR